MRSRCGPRSRPRASSSPPSRSPPPCGISLERGKNPGMPGFMRPDVLVLGGGGILGEAWMTAVLVGLQDATDFDARECDGFVGTSAGALGAAGVVARLRRRSRLGQPPGLPAVLGGPPARIPVGLARYARLAAQAGG